jgi:predicted HAD superfamily phosphohydrolase
MKPTLAFGFIFFLSIVSARAQAVDMAAVVREVDSLIQVSRGLTAKGAFDQALEVSAAAEKRAIETILDGQPSTEFMKFGDTIRIEVKGKDGQTVFGAIDKNIVELEA